MNNLTIFIIKIDKNINYIIFYYKLLIILIDIKLFY